jgi:hypothetical protein
MTRLSRSPAALRSLTVAGTLSASLLLAACGGSSPSSNSTASAEKSREQKFLTFAKCLREHGVDVKTPTGGGPFRIQDTGANPQRLEAAQSACRKYAPISRPNLTPAERVAREEQLQKFAKCMREHGIKVEAKTSNGGAEVRIGIRRGEGGPNPESPAFEAAQKACQSLMPKPPGGLPRGGPPGSGPSTSSSGGGGAGPKTGLQLGG